MSGHTPGPWRCRFSPVGVGAGFNDHREFVVGPDGKDVSGTISHSTELTKYATQELKEVLARHRRPVWSTGDEYPHSANARLIAAAPDMLEALRAIRSTINSHRDGGVEADRAFTVIESDVRRAIAKARGAE